MEPAKRLHPGITALIVITLIGIMTTVVILVDTTSKKSAGTSSTATQPINTAADTATATTYKNGTYNATGSYISPSGQESIELTVTLKESIITDTSLASNATDRNAKDYQTAFASGYKSMVVGKNIDRVSLSRVAGSSLTSNGFNDALDQIKTDAKA